MVCRIGLSMQESDAIYSIRALWSVSQLNTVNSKAVTEKTEKISAGMPLWHAIPRFLFRRY